jgi:hypothetical protein
MDKQTKTILLVGGGLAVVAALYVASKPKTPVAPVVYAPAQTSVLPTNIPADIAIATGAATAISNLFSGNNSLSGYGRA